MIVYVCMCVCVFFPSNMFAYAYNTIKDCLGSGLMFHFCVSVFKHTYEMNTTGKTARMPSVVPPNFHVRKLSAVVVPCVGAQNPTAPLRDGVRVATVAEFRLVPSGWLKKYCRPRHVAAHIWSAVADGRRRGGFGWC